MTAPMPTGPTRPTRLPSLPACAGRPEPTEQRLQIVRRATTPETQEPLVESAPWSAAAQRQREPERRRGTHQEHRERQ